MLTAALRLPTAVGVNVTLIWQESFGARGGPQVLVFSAKSLASGPAMPMLENVNVAAPVFVSVTVWSELVVSIGCGPKVKFRGARETAGKAWRKMRVCHEWHSLAGTAQLLVPV
jgi:hypothetical protein